MDTAPGHDDVRTENPPHLSSEPERFADSPDGVCPWRAPLFRGLGLHLGWSRGTTRFSDLPHPRGTGPERFKGGSCSFGARLTLWPELSRADSNGRYAVGGVIIACIGESGGPGPDEAEDGGAGCAALPFLYTSGADVRDPTAGGWAMTLQRSVPAAGVAHGAMPAQPGAPVRELLGTRAPVVRDLRGRTGCGPYSLDLTAGDIVVVSGSPAAASPPSSGGPCGGVPSTPRTPATAGPPPCPAYCPTPSTGPSSAPRTTSASARPCAPANPSSCTTAAPRPGYAAGSPGTPRPGAAPSI